MSSGGHHFRPSTFASLFSGSQQSCLASLRLIQEKHPDDYTNLKKGIFELPTPHYCHVVLNLDHWDYAQSSQALSVVMHYRKDGVAAGDGSLVLLILRKTGVKGRCIHDPPQGQGSGSYVPHSRASTGRYSLQFFT